MYVLIHSFIHLGILKNIYAVCWQLNIYIFEEYEWSQNSTQMFKHENILTIFTNSRCRLWYKCEWRYFCDRYI